MLDIKRIRENPEAVVKALNSRNSGTFSVDHILELDDKRREIIGRVEQLKAKKNQVSREIPQRKLAGEDLQPLFKEMKEVSEDIKKDDDALADIEKQLRDELLVLPNIPNPDIAYHRSRHPRFRPGPQAHRRPLLDVLRTGRAPGTGADQLHALRPHRRTGLHRNVDAVHG